MARIPRKTRGYYIGGYPDWEERAQVLRLRSLGLTFHQIGEAIGISRQAAHQVYWRALRDLRRPRTENENDEPRW